MLMGCRHFSGTLWWNSQPIWWRVNLDLIDLHIRAWEPCSSALVLHTHSCAKETGTETKGTAYPKLIIDEGETWGSWREGVQPVSGTAQPFNLPKWISSACVINSSWHLTRFLFFRRFRWHFPTSSEIRNFVQQFNFLNKIKDAVKLRETMGRTVRTIIVTVRVGKCKSFDFFSCQCTCESVTTKTFWIHAYSQESRIRAKGDQKVVLRKLRSPMFQLVACGKNLKSSFF